MRNFWSITIVFIGILCSIGCTHKGVLNRNILLDPTMDPTKSRNLGSDVMSRAFSSHEIGATDGSGSSAGTCPTCGG